MVLGLSIVSTVFQPLLERLMLHVLIWGRDRRLKKLVRKSLSGHRRRNQKTALMFTISLAFIIFAGRARSRVLTAHKGTGGGERGVCEHAWV